MEHIQGDQKVSVHLTITIQSSGAQGLFDHPVVTSVRIQGVPEGMCQTSGGCSLC